MKIKFKTPILPILALLIASCNSKEEVDFIVTNANVYTVDSLMSKATAFAVKDGKFLEVGDDKAILAKFESPEIIDAEGKALLPGLIDAHCHFYALGLNQQTVNLVGTNSFDEVLEKVKAFQDEKNLPFVIGRGWDQNDWEDKSFPVRAKLDALFPDTPVVLQRIDGHAYLVNQMVLDLAGITMDTEVSGGDILKKDGELTGVLVDNPMGLVDRIIPDLDMETKIQALKDAQEICFDYGLTTVNDAGLDKSVINLIDSLQLNGDLDMRVYAMISMSKSNKDYYLKAGPYKSEKLDVRSFKVYADGALGSRGAALKKEYSDQHGHFGAMVTPVDEIEDMARELAATDFQMNTHAIGDSANVVVLRAYENALKGYEDKRWKIEHAQIVDTVDFDFFSGNILPSVQPTHATSDMYWASDRLGEERMKGAYAYKTLLEKSGMVALGTDFPVEQVSPFLTFYAAVARKDIEGYPEGGFQMEDALTREETLKGMTIWAAWSNFEEAEKGSIEAGKFADFIILDKDIMEVPEEEIPGIQVESTYVGGKKVK